MVLRLVVYGVVLDVSDVVLFLLRVCVCDLFLFLQGDAIVRSFFLYWAATSLYYTLQWYGLMNSVSSCITG